LALILYNNIQLICAHGFVVLFFCVFLRFLGASTGNGPEKHSTPSTSSAYTRLIWGVPRITWRGACVDICCVRVSEFFFYFKSHCRYFVKKHTHAAHNHFAPSRQNLRRYNIIIVSEGGFSFEWTYTNIILCCIYIFIACVRYTYSVLQLPPAKNVDQMFV
jgi:hypothetical protein